jgi:hypothetical protein
MSGQEMHGKLFKRAWMEGRVFRVAGGRFLDPTTGEERIARALTWKDGKQGEWVSHGIISDSADPTKGNAALTYKMPWWRRVIVFISTITRKLRRKSMLDFNKLPADRKLPAEYNGKIPLDVENAVIEEGAKEPSYRVLCKGGSYEVIPLSAFPKKDEKK